MGAKGKTAGRVRVYRWDETRVKGGHASPGWALKGQELDGEEGDTNGFSVHLTGKGHMIALEQGRGAKLCRRRLRTAKELWQRQGTRAWRLPLRVPGRHCAAGEPVLIPRHLARAVPSRGRRIALD